MVVARTNQNLNKTQKSDYSKYISAGFDPGFGNAKLFLDDKQRSVIPSYWGHIDPNDLADIPESEDGAVIEYLDGSSKDLIGQSFAVGKLATQLCPGDYFKSVSSPENKIDFSLRMLLGTVAVLGIRNELNLALYASVQDPVSLKEKMREALEGTHYIRVNQTYEIKISIKILNVLLEGLGAAFQRQLQQKRQQQAVSQTIAVVDFGTRTILVTVWDKQQLTKSQVLDQGVDRLVERIVNHKEMRRRLGGFPAKYHVVRQAIESGTFSYGKFNFQDIYESEGKLYLKHAFSQIEKTLSDRRPEIQEVLAIGGGALLKGLNNILKKYDIHPAEDPLLANVEGLQKLSSVSLRRLSNGGR